jgi:hypothetical protein
MIHKTPEQIAADKRAKALTLSCIKKTKPTQKQQLVIPPRNKELLPYWSDNDAR